MKHHAALPPPSQCRWGLTDTWDVTECTQGALALVPVLVLLIFGSIELYNLSQRKALSRSGWRGRPLRLAKFISASLAAGVHVAIAVRELGCSEGSFLSMDAGLGRRQPSAARLGARRRTHRDVHAARLAAAAARLLALSATVDRAALLLVAQPRLRRHPPSHGHRQPRARPASRALVRPTGRDRVLRADGDAVP